MLELQSNESNLLSNDDEPVFAEEFEEKFPTEGDPTFDIHLTTGRDWESEETEDGGFTIRTKPDPNIIIYEAESGHIVTLAVISPQPLIFSAFHVGHGNLDDFIERIIESVEEDFEGIEKINEQRCDIGYTDLREVAQDKVEELVNAA